MFFDQAEQVLREGLSFAKEDDKHLFNLHALLGDIYENKGDFTRAVAEYEAAKKACDSNKCNDHKEAYFNLGDGLLRADAPARRTRPSSSSSRSGRSPARERSPPSTATSAPSRRRSCGASAARSSRASRTSSLGVARVSTRGARTCELGRCRAQKTQAASVLRGCIVSGGTSPRRLPTSRLRSGTVCFAPSASHS